MVTKIPFQIVMLAFISTFIFALFPTYSFGEIQTVTHTVKQPFGGSQSPDDARIAAIAKAKREALEKAGTYIESTTVVKNAQVAKDEILALTAGVLKADVVSQKNYTTDDAFGIEVTVRVEVDTVVLEARLKKVLEDRTHFEQLKQARAREKALLEKIAVLEEENRKGGKSDQKAATLKKEFQAASRGLSAGDWYSKSLALWDTNDRKYTDPQKAIEYLNEALRIEPDYADAYIFRGFVYTNDLGQYQRAIKDFDEAIRLKPHDWLAYTARGVAYAGLGQYQRAIRDYDEAIRLKPDNADVYNNRGVAYNILGQRQRAIKDYNKAIHLKPDYALTYNNRGKAYMGLQRPNSGCRDLNKACELGNCEGLAGARQNGYCR